MLVPAQICGTTKSVWGLLPDAIYCPSKCPAWEQLSTTESGLANYRDVWDAFWWANEHRLGQAFVEFINLPSNYSGSINEP